MGDVMEFTRQTIFATGALVWVLVLLCACAWLLFFAIPDLFRWCCYLGWSVAANKAEKEEARKLGRERAGREALRKTS